MKLVSVHPSAQAELLQARGYYEAQWSGLGREFLDEFEAAVRLLLEYPNVGSPERGRLRRWPLRRFPYFVIYAAHPVGLYILAVAHQSRRPGYWLGRKVGA